MNIFTSLRLSAIVLLIFLFTTSYAQKEEDYFITVWDLSLDKNSNNKIELLAETAGEVSFIWETIPAQQSGSGKFNGLNSNVNILNLPLNSTIKLKIAPENLKRIFCSTNYTNLKLIDVKQWGKVMWTGMGSAFNFCVNLNITAIDLPNLSRVSSMNKMFMVCNKLNGPSNINEWNTQNITDMGMLFSDASSFNQPIGNWNTKNVTDMSGMLQGAKMFNQPIGAWNTQNVTDMYSMFSSAVSFNQPIGTWNTDKVSTMRTMFYKANSFNQPIGNWNTSNVTDMSGMFDGDSAFNQYIGNWDTQKVTSMLGMFQGARSFNQPIGKWNTQNVTTMDWMFCYASSFNQRLDSLELNASVSLGEERLGAGYPTMLNSCGIDCKNYSYTLIGWAKNPNTPINKFIEAKVLKYGVHAQTSRNILTKPVAQGGKGWKIIGDALSSEDCEIITGQNDFLGQSLLSIYPNPAQDKLFLKNAIPNTAYKIIDGLGREVNTGRCENEEISLGELPSGLYTLLCGNRHFSFVKE
jgi:surface protein